MWFSLYRTRTISCIFTVYENIVKSDITHLGVRVFSVHCVSVALCTILGARAGTAAVRHSWSWRCGACAAAGRSPRPAAPTLQLLCLCTGRQDVNSGGNKHNMLGLVLFDTGTSRNWGGGCLYIWMPPLQPFGALWWCFHTVLSSVDAVQWI